MAEIDEDTTTSIGEEHVTWLRQPLAGGGTFVNLKRLTDGRVLCCICFNYRTRDKLYRDQDGMLVDVCAGECAQLAGYEG